MSRSLGKKITPRAIDLHPQSCAPQAKGGQGTRLARADNGKMWAANESYALKMNIIVNSPQLQLYFWVRHCIGSGGGN